MKIKKQLVIFLTLLITTSLLKTSNAKTIETNTLVSKYLSNNQIPTEEELKIPKTVK